MTPSSALRNPGVNVEPYAILPQAETPRRIAVGATAGDEDNRLQPADLRLGTDSQVNGIVINQHSGMSSAPILRTLTFCTARRTSQHMT